MPRLLKAVDDDVELFLFVRIHVVAGGADERAADGRVEFGDGLVKRVEVDVRHARIEQAVEAFDEADDLDS